MYLIDSIVKNFGDVYMNLFSKNLVSIFSNVFEKVGCIYFLFVYKIITSYCWL